ncbi:MAG: hypothetical protein OXN18_11440 [Gemmatimonadota bacterium]|nr:hypothetical protein [Gemmatimonadota bacterium]
MRRRWLPAGPPGLDCGLFGITVVPGGFTIGILFLASAGVALVGTCVAASRRHRERPGGG